MKIIEFVLAERTINNPFYVYENIRNTDKCRIFYLFRFFITDYTYRSIEYLEPDLEAIVNEPVNIIETEDYMYIEENIIFYNSDETILCVDRRNVQDIYIASAFYISDFQRIWIDKRIPSEQDYIEALKQDKYGYFKIDRKNFFEILKEWGILFAAKSPYILLYQDDQHKVGLKSFESLNQAEKFIINSMGEEEYRKSRTPESYK